MGPKCLSKQWPLLQSRQKQANTEGRQATQAFCCYCNTLKAVRVSHRHTPCYPVATISLQPRACALSSLFSRHLHYFPGTCALACFSTAVAPKELRNKSGNQVRKAQDYGLPLLGQSKRTTSELGAASCVPGGTWFIGNKIYTQDTHTDTHTHIHIHAHIHTQRRGQSAQPFSKFIHWWTQVF